MGIIVPEHIKAELERERAEREKSLADTGKPDMSEAHLEAILAAVPDRTVMIEFGSGYSTPWFAERLWKRGSYLLSVEHDEAWAKKIGKLIEHHNHAHVIHIQLPRDPGPYGTFFRENPVGLDQYLLEMAGPMRDGFRDPTGKRPLRVRTVLVDGLARGACVAVAARFCDHNTTVFVHDAQRGWYNWSYPFLADLEMIPPGEGHPASLLKGKIQRSGGLVKKGNR